MTEAQVARIRTWMLTVVQDGSWQRYNDLHIDDIDNTFLDRSNWLARGLEALNTAASIRESLGLGFIVALGIELQSSTKPTGVNFKNRIALEQEMSESPPSLYAFLPDWKNWVETLQRGVPVDPKSLGIDAANCTYYEYFSVEDMEYRRSLFVWANPEKTKK